jgi:hypothetical protein
MNGPVVSTISLRKAMSAFAEALSERWPRGSSGAFDRVAYQKKYMRGYMREYRAAKKIDGK